MERSEARKRRPSRVVVPKLLAALGVDGRRRGRAVWALCPVPAHAADSEPSWSIVDDLGAEDHGEWYCHGCQNGGGPARLVAMVLGIAGADVRAWLAKHADPGAEGESPRPVAKILEVAPRLPSSLEWPVPGAIEPARWPEIAVRYWTSKRGLLLDLAVEVGAVATTSESPVSRSIVIPVHAFGALRSWTARSYVPGARRHMTPRREHGAQPELALWGEPSIAPGSPAVANGSAVLVCEGVFDALSLVALGYPAVVAVLGAGQVTPAKVAAICRTGKVVVCTDRDEAGEKAAAKIAATLARHARVERALPPEGHDFGDAPVEAIYAAVDAAIEVVEKG